MAFLLALVVFWRFARPPGPDLNANKVVGFPLVERGGSAGEPGEGETAAVFVGHALQYSEPLLWIDGWPELDVEQRADIRLLDREGATFIARRLGARYFLDGSIAAVGDSVTVGLRLYDVQGDSVVMQRSRTEMDGKRAVNQLAHRVLLEILPALIDPGRSVDVSPLARQDAGAVASWLQGEREYRRSRFLPALEYLERAVEQDSSLAYAALRGAETAGWKAHFDDASRLIDVALRHDSLLVARDRIFAQGLKSFLDGSADSAVAQIQLALAEETDWPEAWMLLGEVYFHLLPKEAPRDSLAEAAFETAIELDPEFTPPLLHLAELVALRGDHERASDLINRFASAGPDTALMRRAVLAVDCAGGTPMDWPAVAEDNPHAVFEAGHLLAGGGLYPTCAEGALRSAVTSPRISPQDRWAATIALQGLLMAQGRIVEAEAVSEDLLASGQGAANYLLALAPLATGTAITPRAGSILQGVEGRAGGDYTGLRNLGQYWLLALWYERRAKEAPGSEERQEFLDRIGRVWEVMGQRADSSGVADDRLLADVIGARLALAGAATEADTTQAIKLLRGLSPSGPRSDLVSSPWQCLAGERMLLAEVLEFRGEDRGAYRTAAEMDFLPCPVSLLYLKESLSLRLRATEGLGDTSDAARLRRRIDGLGGE
jgi:Flp pilus assembly protein TadD